MRGPNYSFSAWFVNANVNGLCTGNTSNFEVWVKGTKNKNFLETGLLGKTIPWTMYSGNYNAYFTETIELSIVNLETIKPGLCNRGSIRALKQVQDLRTIK